MRAERAGTEAGVLLRPDWGRALPRPALGCVAEGQRRAGVVAASLGLHVALGFLAVLATWPPRHAEAPAAPVEMVFEAPSDPAPALEAAGLPTPEAVQEVTPELAEPPPATTQEAALAQLEPVAEPSPVQAAPPPPALIPKAKAPPQAALPEPLPIAPPAPQIVSAPPLSAVPPPPVPLPRTARLKQPAPARTVRREASAAAHSAAPAAPAPTAPAPAAAAPNLAAPAPAVIDDGWRASLAAWVRSRQRYPDAARRVGVEGAATVRFTVRSDGEVIAAQLARATGSDLLDGPALAMFRGAHAPPFPAGMTQPQITLTITVRYRLEE